MQEQRHKKNKAEPKEVKKEFREESSSMKQRITLETKSQVGFIKNNQVQMTKEVHQELVHTCMNESRKANSRTQTQPTKDTINSRAFCRDVRNKRRLRGNNSFIGQKGKVIIDHIHQRGAHIFFYIKMEFS